MPRCKSRVDALWRNHAAPPDERRPFEPFTAPPHVQAVPALYVGFNPLDMSGTRVAFPSNKWIQMRMEVDEYDHTSEVRLLWQYWNGRIWSNLRVVDETLSLRRSGYVSFFGPEDHKPSTEFGTTAFWLRVLPESTLAGERDLPALPAIRMRTLLLNTVPAVNGGVIIGELLGFSNGEPNQRFTLTHSPILPDILLEVREPEVHSESEHRALAQAGALAAPLADDPNLPDHEEWVAWKPVSSFYGCGPDSRCYLFDPIQGEIRFGDGKHGRIPPPGKSNIRVRRYRIHNGAAGNLPRAALTVLRNPSGALSDIQGVTNLALAVGGVDAEAVDQTKRRGPHSLKHRQQPVMAEDYQWITLEADNVARAYCLPTRDPQGARQPGWVTVVVVPQSAESKPLPAPAALRQIRNRLEGLALANLKQFDAVEPGERRLRQDGDVDQIHVVGPQYMEVQIRGEIVPLEPEKGDDVRLAVLRRLAEFMHPLSGGPERQGWEPGRDVHISEVAAEIESVPGVDHLEKLSLGLAGIQHRSLLLANVRPAPLEMPAGSLVTTFDGRIKMVLAKTWRKNEETQSLMVYGFMLGDPVTLLTPDGGILATDQTIAQVESMDRTLCFETPVPWLIIDGKEQLFVKGPHTRLAVERYLRVAADDETAPVAGVVVRGVQPGDDGFAVDDIVTILTAEGLSLAFDLVIADIDPTHNLVRFQQSIPWPQTNARLILRGKDASVAIKERLFSREKDDQGNPLLTGVVLRGYEPDEQPLQAGDQVQLVHADGAPITTDLKVSAVERFDNTLYFAQGIPLEKVWSAQPRELILQGKQTRMLVEQGKVVTDEQGQALLAGVVVRGFKSGDLLSVVHRDQPRRRIDFLPVDEIKRIESLTRIYVPDDHLVFSGQHQISLAPGV
ncbi:MAG: baseplate J/gp47 family protein [Caldilineaceae bacterium]|nr:baseplate J/gp47 family protein [Caldilineaceae bacterium]